MRATTLLSGQLTGIHGLMREVIGNVTPDEWTARPYAGGNMLGFLAWHLPATQDWAIHTWIRGVPELRARQELAAYPGLNPPCAPFRRLIAGHCYGHARQHIGDILTSIAVLRARPA